jgi:hypothetical protein
MALRGTLTHRKTRRLAALLKIEMPAALGYMEALWSVAAEQTPCGDIGKLSNQDIADEMFSTIDPDELINAIIGAGLLEKHSIHRLIIHNWAERTDQTTRRKVARNDWTFVNSEKQKLATASNSYPKLVMTSLPEPEPEPEPDKTLGGFCNKTPPSTSDETNDNPSTSRVKPSKYKQEELEERWKTQLDAYPSRGKADRCIAKGKLAYFKLIKQGENPEAILRGTQGYAAAMKTLGNDGTAYVKQLPTFFNNRTWEEYLVIGSPTNGKPQPPHLTPVQMADGCSYVWSENTWKLYTPSNDFEVMK